MSFGAYLRRNFGEFVLVLISAWATATVGLNAFFLDGLIEQIGWWGRAGITLVIVALLVLALYIASFRRDRLVPGLMFYIALLAIIVSCAMVFSSGESIYEDVEGNYLYLSFVVIISATACFGLTRTLVGGALWFVGSAFACSVVQAFYQTEEIALSILAAFSGLALIVYRNFRLGLEKSDQASAGARIGGFTSSAASVAAVFAAALALWFGVIAPLNPGVLEVTLLTDYRTYPIEELRGVGDTNPVLNFSMTSENLVDGFYYTTDDLKEDPTSDVVIDAETLFQQQMEEQLTGEAGTDADAGTSSGGATQEDFSTTAEDELNNPQSYTYRFPWIIVVIALICLGVAGIVAYFVGRRAFRTKRLREILGQTPEDQVKTLYRFELGRLRRLGFDVPVGMTLSEFAHSSRRSMDMLTEETCVPFDRLTETYCSCTYGNKRPSEDEIVPFVAYYQNFWKAARTQLGNFRYFFKSFRL